MSNVNKEFVLAGRAVFTIEVPDSFRNSYKGRHGVEVKPHYTYRVSFKKATGNFNNDAYFLQLLTGPDNTKSYTYLAMLVKESGAVRITGKSCREEGSVEVALARRALARIWADEVESIEAVGFKLHHEGRCGKCGRALTTPESVERGIGPECWGRMGGDSKAVHGKKAKGDELGFREDEDYEGEPDPTLEAESLVDRAVHQ